ncbi:phosphoesterase [bacterium]|nr:phosphoesterase [bacterium]
MSDDELPPPTSHWNRRRFIKLGALGLVGSGLLGYTTFIEPHWLKVIRQPMPMRGLPAPWQGRTILQLSDLHIGPRVDPDYMIRVLRMAAALEPDMVVITGDITDKPDPSRWSAVARVLQHLPRAPLGTYSILGNHDYGAGWSHPELAAGVAGLLTDAGATVLRNQRIDIDGLQLIGFDDWWANSMNAAAALSGLDHDRAALVLCHNPDVCDLDVWGDYKGWILSGHTHGGQCKPPFLPPPLLPVKNRLYTRGHFPLSNDRQLHISAGAGHLTRVRFNVRPDITLFTVRGVA